MNIPLVAFARTPFVFAIAMLLGMSAAFAQTPAPVSGAAASGNTAADQQWAALLLLTMPPPRTAPVARKTRDEHVALHAQQVINSRNAAQAAKDFYTRYPGDARAAQARKLEVISALRGVESDDPVQEASAIATARGFRTDLTRDVRDRFEVATAMDNQELNLKRKAGLITNVAAERKKLVENWRTEFGDLAEIESYAVNVARHADPATATAMSIQIGASPRASAAMKKEAAGIRARAMLLGKPVILPVSLLDGGTLNLEEQTGHVTIVVVWSPGKPESLAPLQAVTSSLPRGAEVVALALGGTPGDVNRVRHTLPAVKYFGHAPIGPAANKAAGALRLQLAPYAYILNGTGILTDFGPLVELPSLLVRAGVITIRQS